MKKNFTPSLFGFLVFFSAFVSNFSGLAQCTLTNDGTLGTSIVASSGLCAPRTVTIQYSFGLTSPVPAGSSFAAVFNWNDGQANQIQAVFLPVGTGQLSYVVSASRTFPANSDCEYEVLMGTVLNGFFCDGFQQIQRVNSWRLDNANGGNIALAPTPSDYCPGVNISQIGRAIRMRPTDGNKSFTILKQPRGPGFQMYL